MSRAHYSTLLYSFDTLVAPLTKPTFSHASFFPLGTAKIVTIVGQIGTFSGGFIPPDFLPTSRMPSEMRKPA